MVVALNGIMLFISILTQESEVSIFSALQKQAALSDHYNTVSFLTGHQSMKGSLPYNAKNRSWTRNLVQLRSYPATESRFEPCYSRSFAPFTIESR